ncbi:Pumilio domain-containing protein, partial [Stegodyphus mimosarum]
MQTQKQNAGKPKQAKLWKNSPSLDKKSPNFNSEKKEAFGIGKSNTYKSAKRKKFQQNKNVNMGSNKKWNILGKDQVETPKEGSNKRKNESSEGTGPNKKAKKSSMTLKDRKKYRLSKKGKLETFEIGQTLKILWEELRRDDCKPERKIQLIKQVCELLKGRVKEFTFAHDTVRVLECVFALGAETYRSLLFEELKDDIIPLAKSKYGRFLLLKALKYGTK